MKFLKSHRSLVRKRKRIGKLDIVEDIHRKKIPNLTKLMVVAESIRAVGDTEIAVFILKTNQKARTAFLDND